jgi:hypothetical protein
VNSLAEKDFLALLVIPSHLRGEVLSGQSPATLLQNLLSMLPIPISGHPDWQKCIIE